LRPEPTWEELEAEYEIIWDCYSCGRKLDPRYDYFCPMCENQNCDRCSQACQVEDCDEITCFGCVEFHLLNHHPGFGNVFQQGSTVSTVELQATLKRGLSIAQLHDIARFFRL